MKTRSHHRQENMPDYHTQSIYKIVFVIVKLSAVKKKEIALFSNQLLFITSRLTKQMTSIT